VVPKHTGELLQAAAGADQGEIWTERPAIPPDGVTTIATPRYENPAPGDGISGE
jgi:hypothetical protein